MTVMGCNCNYARCRDTVLLKKIHRCISVSTYIDVVLYNCIGVMLWVQDLYSSAFLMNLLKKNKLSSTEVRKTKICCHRLFEESELKIYRQTYRKM